MKVGAVAVIAALCAVMVKGTARQLALALSLAAAAVILGLALGALEDVVAMAEDLRDMAGLSPAVMEYILKTTLTPRFGGVTGCDEIGLPVTATGGVVPCGSTALWEAAE